jgi:hypothetical protein
VLHWRDSNIQAYLDLYARGSRDFKQADCLLDNARMEGRVISYRGTAESPESELEELEKSSRETNCRLLPWRS